MLFIWEHCAWSFFFKKKVWLIFPSNRSGGIICKKIKEKKSFYIVPHNFTSFFFVPQFDYVPDASMIQQRRGTSAKPLVSFNTATFHGVHKTLEMKQCLDHSGQPMFITNSSYCIKGRLEKRFDCIFTHAAI